MPKIMIEFPNGDKKEYEKGVSALDIAKSISEGLARDVVAVKIDDNVIDAFLPIEKDCKIQLLKFSDKEGEDIFRHSSSHLLAQAVLRLFPNAKPTIGPVVEEGFYYDFDVEKPFLPEDIENIEKEMEKIVKENFTVSREEPNKKEALEMFKSNEYKVEMINEMEDNVSVYRQGEFFDLCRGPHIPRTGMIKAFKIIKLAGAYWRADVKNRQLQRLYGISFPDKKLLNEHLKMLEEAKKRDHRTIGKDLDLFDVCEEVGPGLIFWLPRGNIIKEQLEDWAKETEKRWGYKRVTTPIITKEGLFQTSEHLPHYKDSMYAPMKIDNENYYIKPMNCPFHHMVFKARKRSYRDMPLRIAEYGWCHRYEDSGAITGLLRVRGMQMNDAHIYCTEEQAMKEFIDVIKLHQYYYDMLGIKDYWMDLCLRNPESSKYHGNEEMWKKAEDITKKAMEMSGVKYTIQNDGAAFYGPKVDFQIKSVTGRVFTASTNQIDLFMPGKFGLSYAGEDGKEHIPAVIHRAPLGTHERFIGFLIEHFAGKFPLWLNPEQVRVLTVSEKFNDYAMKIVEHMKNLDIRAEADVRAESIPKKVREAQLDQVNYMLVVGEKEIGNDTVTIRTRNNEILGAKDYKEFTEDILKEIKERRL